MAKVAILGADGSMGRLVAKVALAEGDLEVVANFTVDVSPNVGADIGVLASGTPAGIFIQPMQYFKEIMESTRPDVLIDFTLPEGTETSTKWAISEGFPAVIGTTGLSDGFLAWVKHSSEELGTTVVLTSNFAIGMNIFFKISADLAKLVPGWDVEIIETHHHRKRDSPSGTALRIASGIADALGVDLDEVAKFGRDKGVNPRKLGEKEIGIHAIRAGDILGDHVVLYGGPGEVIELTHRLTNREALAQGAVKAAKFVIKNPALGRVLSMQDVLEL